MNPIGPVWRFTVCDTDGLQATVHLGPVKRAGQDLSASLTMTITLPMPDQDEHLPDLLEAAVHAAGLEVQRQLFGALIEKADRELILDLRDGKGGQGIQRRGRVDLGGHPPRPPTDPDVRVKRIWLFIS